MITCIVINVFAIIFCVLNIIIMIKNKDLNYRISAILYAIIAIMFAVYLMYNSYNLKIRKNYVNDLERTVNELRFEKEYVDYTITDSQNQ